MTAALITTPDRDRSDPAEDRDLLHLRQLLLDDDRRDVASIRAALSRLDARLGTDARFCSTLTDHLVAALKAAEVENHRGLAAVMAPLVVSGIRREIVESRDVMVEALYPITGRLVAAAVGAAMKQLSEDINRKLEASLSPRQLQLRLKALVTRQKLSDLVLADAGRGRLQRLILIDRASGAVLAATDTDGRGEPEPDSALNLLGGLVSAIVQFAGHALADAQGELRQLDFGGQMVMLRASPLFILAAITAGAPNARLPHAVDAAFLGFLENLRTESANGEATALSGLHERVAGESAPAEKKPLVSPLKVVAGLLVALVAYGTAHTWMNARQRHDEEIALVSIERLPAFDGYPLDLSFDRDAKTILARGILPTRADANVLRDEIAAAFPLWRFKPRVAIVSETPFARATEAALRDQTARTADLAQKLASGQEALAGLRVDVDRKRALTDDETKSLIAGQKQRTLDAIDREARLATATKVLEAKLASTADALAGLRADVDRKDALTNDATKALAADQRKQAQDAIDRETRLGAATKALEAKLASTTDALVVLRADLDRESRLTDEATKTLVVTQKKLAQGAIDLEARLMTTAKALDAMGDQTARNNAIVKRELLGVKTEQHAAVTHAADLDVALAGATTKLADLRTEIKRVADAARDESREIGARTAVQSDDIEGTRRSVDQLAAKLITPQSRLEDSVRKIAVFFDAGATYRDPQRAARDLGLLAKALKDVPDARLRVVGYGDGSGTARGNLDAAKMRAEHVVTDLVGLGVDAKRLRVVATRSPYPIVDEPSNGANRRAVFELAFAAE